MIIKRNTATNEMACKHIPTGTVFTYGSNGPVMKTSRGYVYLESGEYYEAPETIFKDYRTYPKVTLSLHGE